MNRLKELRIERGLSQSKLAKMLNISQQSISHYEKGIRDIDNTLVSSFANFFNVSIDYFLGKSDIKNAEQILIDKDITSEISNMTAETLLNFVYGEKNLISNLCFFTKDDDPSVDSYFPFKLTFLREKKGISQKELAEQLKYYIDAEIKADNIEEFEKGYRVPSNIFLKSLSKIFNIPFYAVSDSDDLFDIEKQVKKLITLLGRKNNPMKVSNTELDDEDREYIELCFEKLLTDIKIYIKQKYLLKKYSNPIDAEVEAYRMELEAEQKAKTSLVSEELNEDLRKNAK